MHVTEHWLEVSDGEDDVEVIRILTKEGPWRRLRRGTCRLSSQALLCPSSQTFCHVRKGTNPFGPRLPDLQPRIQTHLDWLQSELELLNRALRDQLQHHPACGRLRRRC